jgi:hypothetical protein
VSRHGVFRHEFVEFIPGELEEGVIYVSIPYATAVHLCACGCGCEVPTPISPTDWKVTFDGATVSLDPSIGNWSFPCQSHYWIKRGGVRWARKWSRGEIEAGRARSRRSKERYVAGLPVEEFEPRSDEAASEGGGLLRRLWRQLGL